MDRNIIEDWEIWDLKKSIAEFIEPRLYAYKEKALNNELISIPNWVITNEIENNLTESELRIKWISILEQMIFPFSYQNNPMKYSNKYTQDEIDYMFNKGMKLFAKHYKNLWD